MNDTIAQNEKRQRECNLRSNELYKSLSMAGDKASVMISDLNSHKLRIFIAKIKLFFDKINGNSGGRTSGGAQGGNIISNFQEVFLKGNQNSANSKAVTKEVGQKKHIIALLLVCIPYTGLTGMHEFYLGKPETAVIKLCTLNYFFIGWVIDVLRILTKNYTDGQGKMLQ